MSEESEQLLRELEQQNGGTISFKTYAVFIGRSGTGLENLGGLLYTIEDRLIFEDFEKQHNSLSMLLGKKKEAYEKFKIEFPVGQIMKLRELALPKAQRIAEGRLKAEKCPPIGPWSRYLSRIAVELQLSGGDALYFELFDPKGFFSHITQIKENQ